MPTFPVSARPRRARTSAAEDSPLVPQPPRCERIRVKPTGGCRRCPVTRPLARLQRGGRCNHLVEVVGIEGDGFRFIQDGVLDVIDAGQGVDRLLIAGKGQALGGYL